MNWSERTVDNSISVEKYSVNDIFISYLQDRFYVNRRYQRKLVWGLREKQLLVDSMLKKIPLPAILLVKFDIESDEEYNLLEIVDGMQRLNAIITFILGEFGVEYNGELCYFDPNAYSETFQLFMDNDRRLKKNEGAKFLPKDVCVDFYRYYLPAIVTGKDDAVVDMIFSRINSTGRKISNHDLRQSMAIGEFPDLVRRIASDVRMDNTYTDHILLSEIPKISIGSGKHGYGVELDTVFWRRHDLINAPNIKESRDEELIEELLALVLLRKFKRSKDNLNKLYEQGTAAKEEIESKVAEVGKDILEDRFKKVFDIFDMIFDSVNSDFSSYIFTKKNTKNKDECFKVLFLALYRLIQEGYIATDYSVIAKSIKDATVLFDSFIKADKVDYNTLWPTVDNLYKILISSFSKEIVVEDSEMTREINKRLGYSKIESQLTEFKIGVSNFNSGSINENTIKKIARTLVAMANISDAKEEGMIIIGIADTKESYADWYKAFKEPALIVNQHYVPGITKEAEKLFGSTDAYYRMLGRAIEEEPISPKLKRYILETFEVLNYNGTELLIFKSKYMGEESLYDGKEYVRYSNETLCTECEQMNLF